MKTPHFWWVKRNKIHRCYTPPPLSYNEIQERALDEIWQYDRIKLK